jgi:hypothetical protein
MPAKTGGMSKKLIIAEDLHLPLDAVTQKFAFLGRTGSGKTYAAQKLAEEMLAASGQVVTLDPVGVWYSLRIAADGKSPGIQLPVFGGLHGDVPIEPTGGALIADVIADHGTSAVIDVSQFESDNQKCRFAGEFAARLFFRKKASPSALMLFIEEAQEFIPEKPYREEIRMLHEFKRLGKIGRNFGIGLALISQRPQTVSKEVLNMTECMFAFQMTGPHERKTIRQWVEQKGSDLDIIGLLPGFEVGQAHVWSPQWLKFSKTIKILPKWTVNATSTPAVGSAKRNEPKPLDSADLDRLRTNMAATIERAKATDPRELAKQLAQAQKKIAELENRATLGTAAAGVPAATLGSADKHYQRGYDAATKDLHRASEQHKSRVRKEMTAVARESKALHDKLQKELLLATEHLGFAAQAHNAMADLGRRTEMIWERNVSEAVPEKPETEAAEAVHRPRTPVRTPPVEGDGDRRILPAEQRILDAIAEFEALQIPNPARVQVAFMAGYTNLNSKGFVNALGALRSAGQVDYPSSGSLCLTDAGRDRATAVDAPTSTERLQQRLMDMLGGANARILKLLIEAYPDSVDRADLGSKAGYGNLNSKGFVNAIGRLRTLGLIDYPERGQVKAQPVLFLRAATA